MRNGHADYVQRSGYHRRALIVVAALAAILSVTGCSTVRSSLPQSEWSDQPELAVTVEELVGGLERPWSVAWLPDGRMLITERLGSLLLTNPDGSNPVEVQGVPTVHSAGQGGLLDIITLRPGVETPPEDAVGVAIVYSSGTADANRTEVATFVMDTSGASPRLRDQRVIFANNEYKRGNQHFGARILQLPDDTLLVSIGDGGNPPLRFGDQLQREQAQEPINLFGNIVRVGVDGAVPEDNPFVGRDGFRPELYTYGNRNIQGLAIDARTGLIWATEHGSRGGDEVNIVVAGENYGWPLVSHSREYVRGTRISRTPTLEGYADPALVWLDTVAPSGLAVSDRTLFAGGLRSRSVHVLEMDAEGEFVSESVIPIGARVRDVRIGPDRALYVLTDEADTGRLLRITM